MIQASCCPAGRFVLLIALIGLAGRSKRFTLLFRMHLGCQPGGCSCELARPFAVCVHIWYLMNRGARCVGIAWLMRDVCLWPGNDPHASALHRVIQSHNVDLSLCTTAEVASGQAFILLQSMADLCDLNA